MYTEMVTLTFTILVATWTGADARAPFFLADCTIQESVAQGFEIVALGAFPASISSIGSQLVVRAGAPIFLVSIRKFRGWKFHIFCFKMAGKKWRAFFGSPT